MYIHDREIKSIKEMKMYACFSNYIEGIDDDFINHIQTIEDFRIKKKYVQDQIEYLKWEIYDKLVVEVDDDDDVSVKKFRGKYAKEKKESYMINMKDMKKKEYQLIHIERLLNKHFSDESELFYNYRTMKSKH